MKVTNKDYFFVIDNQIRKQFPKYEVRHILPKAKAVLDKSGISNSELIQYSPEGYYYKSPQLSEYFMIMRNFQENADIYKRIDTECEEFKFLKDVTDLPLFGHVKSIKNLMMGKKASPLPRRWDILALTLHSTEDGGAKPWSMENILEGLSKNASGNANLVELAYLTKDTECLVAGAETNTLYRDIMPTKSMHPSAEWLVDPEVEALGEKIIDEYNKRFQLQIKKMDKRNAHLFYHYMQPERPRVASLGYVQDTGDTYYWITDPNGNVREEYSKVEITTESEKKKAGKEAVATGKQRSFSKSQKIRSIEGFMFIDDASYEYKYIVHGEEKPQREFIKKIEMVPHTRMTKHIFDKVEKRVMDGYDRQSRHNERTKKKSSPRMKRPEDENDFSF